MRRSRPTLGVALLGAVAFLVPAAGAHALWSASATGTLSVNTAAPFTLACTGVSTPAPGYTVDWNPVSNATYEVSRSADQVWTQADVVVANGSATSYTATTWSNNQTSYFRVRAIVSGTEAAVSNTLKVVRSGGGASNNFSCGTP
jgi:hypothetical protein